jgi:hypothetical protein
MGVCLSSLATFNPPAAPFACRLHRHVRVHPLEGYLDVHANVRPSRERGPLLMLTAYQEVPSESRRITVQDELWLRYVIHCPPDSEVKVFVLISRKPRPDFASWPGRRVLAVLDAVAWPVAVLVVVATSPINAGALGAVLIVIAAFAGVCRLCRALWRNERYRFTTWVWGKRLAALLLVGLLLKLALQVR